MQHVPVLMHLDAPNCLNVSNNHTTSATSRLGEGSNINTYQAYLLLSHLVIVFMHLKCVKQDVPNTTIHSHYCFYSNPKRHQENTVIPIPRCSKSKPTTQPARKTERERLEASAFSLCRFDLPRGDKVKEYVKNKSFIIII